MAGDAERLIHTAAGLEPLLLVSGQGCGRRRRRWFAGPLHARQQRRRARSELAGVAGGQSRQRRLLRQLQQRLTRAPAAAAIRRGSVLRPWKCGCAAWTAARAWFGCRRRVSTSPRAAATPSTAAGHDGRKQADFRPAQQRRPLPHRTRRLRGPPQDLLDRGVLTASHDRRRHHGDRRVHRWRVVLQRREPRQHGRARSPAGRSTPRPSRPGRRRVVRSAWSGPVPSSLAATRPMSRRADGGCAYPAWRAWRACRAARAPPHARFDWDPAATARPAAAPRSARVATGFSARELPSEHQGCRGHRGSRARAEPDRDRSVSPQPCAAPARRTCRRARRAAVARYRGTSHSPWSRG